MARPTYAEALTIAQSDPIKLLAMVVSQQEPDGTAISGGGSLDDVNAAALGSGTVKNLIITVGTSIYTVAPATGTWAYLKVINNHDTAILYVAINEDPVLGTDAATPAAAGDWDPGYPVAPGESSLLPLTGTITTIRLLSDTASTPVVLGLVA